VNKQERLQLVRRLIDVGLPKVFRYPGMKEELQVYVSMGDVEAIREKRLRALMINLQARQLKKLDERRLREIMLEYLVPAPGGDDPTYSMDDAPKKSRRKRRKGGIDLTPTITMGLLLYGFIGIMAILFLTQQPGYWQTPTGQALATAFLITTVGFALLAVIRNQARSALQLIFMIILTLAVGVAVYLSVRSGTIDLNTLADEAAANPERAVGFGLLGVAIAMGFMLFVLRRIIGTALLIILVILMALLALSSLRFGGLDLQTLFG